MNNPGESSDAGVDARQSPFYEWLNYATIRELVQRSLELSAGERLVLIKGLVPGLVEAMGAAKLDAFLAEVAIKARRFEEAVEHPGQGRRSRVTPGEELGGPTPAGHEHIAMARDPDQRGAREAERDVEGGLWACTEYMSRSAKDPAHKTPADGSSVDETPTGMGSESAEGINDVGTRPEGERSGLDDRAAGRSFRAGADRSGSEPLVDREWVHESGYGGRGGEPRISSDEREDSEREDSEREDSEREDSEREDSEREDSEREDSEREDSESK